MKIAAAIKTLNAAAAKFGGCVEDDSHSDVVLQVCAPDGKVWAASGSTMLIVTTARGPQEWLDEAVEDALQRIAYGVANEEEVK